MDAKERGILRFSGINAVGVSNAVVDAYAVLGGMQAFFFGSPNRFLGLVYNNTDLSLVVKDWEEGTSGADAGDLYCKSGSMISFMDTTKSGSTRCQIDARQIARTSDPHYPDLALIPAGIFVCSTKAGEKLLTSQNAMIFQDQSADFEHHQSTDD